jgi:hypothetical protein
MGNMVGKTTTHIIMDQASSMKVTNEMNLKIAEALFEETVIDD